MRYGCEADIAEEEGYDPDEMEDSDWDKLWEIIDYFGGMEKGYNIVVDNMNLNPKTCAELEKTVKDFNENYTYDWKYEVEYKDFFIPVDECIRRDAMRPNPIGEKVIKATWRRYRDFIIQEDIKSMLKKSPKHVDGGRPVILVDMDATLCLNTTGRPYFGEGTPEIIAATKKWLAKHDIIVDDLFFRPVKDYSPGADCKKKIYEDNIKGKYNVQFVLEDNYKCVKMWREQGLVCLQPNEGKF